MEYQILARAPIKPFLKWAGGKAQLWRDIEQRLPEELQDGRITRYVEPFIGGGAVFFRVLQQYRIDHAVISDINPELILMYRTLKRSVEPVIQVLRRMERAYVPLADSERKEYYYGVRSRLNETLSAMDFATYSGAWVLRTAQLIFLNRTCFNGLFRVNSKGEFNVPIGRYRRPVICNADTLRADAEVLQRTVIQSGDFTDCEWYVDAHTFVYFDPPYRPLSPTSRFTSYSKYDFDDAEQLRLAQFYRRLDAKGAKLMLSNSDPQNANPKDDFFEEAFAGYRLERVQARRSINSQTQGRGAISELLIVNY